LCLLFIASKGGNSVKSVCFRFLLFYSSKIFILEAKMGTNSSLLNSKNGEKMSHQIEKNNIEGTHIPYNSLREYGYDFKSKII
jgi:hypothetical protein